MRNAIFSGYYIEILEEMIIFVCFAMIGRYMCRNYLSIQQKIMKIKSLFAAVMASAMAFVACENGKVDLGTPSIALSLEEVTLEAAGGEATVDVTATRDWTVKFDETADWLVVDPASGTASADAQQVTVSALSNDGYDREVSVEFSIGMQTKYLTVKQVGPKGSADALVIYANDYDKEVAQKTYSSSGDKYPYLDQFDGWMNHKGTGAANVTYSFKGMSVRSNSTSDSNYSDYPGSGNNNMFFGSSAYFSTNGIALGEATNLELTFGTEKYSEKNGSKFTKSEYHIWVSADGQKWVELTDYTFAGGETEGRWNVATANFSVPAGTANLSICMEVTVASSYRMDDFKLVASTKEGTAVDFSKAVAKDFGAGSTGGDNTGGNTGGEVTPPTGAIFFESFASGKGDFTIDDKTLPEGLTYVWYEDTQYKNMKASAFKDEVKYATESWLISPEVDLTSVTAAYLLFEHTGKHFGTMADEATVYAKKAGGEWAKLTIPTYMSGNDWTFVSSGAINLKDYVGGKMQFAFKYVSTSNAAGTWEIKNVCVSPTAESTGGNTGGGNTGGGDNGDGGLTPPSDVELDPNATIITLDASSKLCDAFPEGSTGVNVTTSYTIDGYNWTFSPSSGNKFSWYTDGYVLWGKKNGYILLPSVEGKSLSWVLILTGKNASVAVEVGVYSEDGTIAVTGGEPIILNAKNSVFTYNLSDTEVGARYRFQIVNDKNAQFQKLTLIYE